MRVPIISPFHKKEDKSHSDNYRTKEVYSVKCLTVLLARLHEFRKKIAGPQTK